jgi:uncharacterized protein (TIGR02646 family)
VIRVKKPRPPVVLVGNASKAGVERELATTFYAVAANADASFDFGVYRDPEVKAALNEAFGFKCAYCESPYGATQPLDVEHFRPKGAFDIVGGRQKPGYYWLAATWENLLPSCIDCNRARTQTLPDGTTQTLGKANQFPIEDERQRARRPGDEKNEGRLLLHPYLDRPERHLCFKEDGIVGWQAPGRRPSQKAEMSVHVFALLRDGLVRARKARQKELATEIEIAERLAAKLDALGGDPELESILEDQLANLRAKMMPDAAYSAMARQMIEPRIRRLTGT